MSETAGRSTERDEAVGRCLPPPEAMRAALAGVGAAPEPGAGPEAGLAERFARLVWATTVEPGDGDAGHLVATLGAAGALAAVRSIDRPQAAPRAFALAAEAAAAAADPEAGRDRVAGTAASGCDGAGSAALDDRRDWAAAVERWRPRIEPVRAAALAARARECGARLLLPDAPEWPCRLDDLGDHAPLALWVRGDVTLLARWHRNVAVVGARAATAYGEHTAIELASGLADRGLVVVSGGAFGIDGAAHRASLAADAPTVAVMAGGLDRLYPVAHRSLLERVIAGGAVVSELPCGQAPTRWRFLMRNRLISALSAATVVVEAGARSGALNTAAHAAQLGRALAAVPGPVTSAASIGCHLLIRQRGARLVTSALDVVELVVEATGGDRLVDDALMEAASDDRSAAGPGGAMRAAPAGGAGGPGRPRDAVETRVLDAMSRTAARSVDEIVLRSGASAAEARRRLATLEIEGVVERRGGGWARS